LLELKPSLVQKKKKDKRGAAKMTVRATLSLMFHYLMFTQHAFSTRYALMFFSCVNAFISFNHVVDNYNNLHIFRLAYQLIRLVISALSLLALSFEWLNLLLIVMYIFEVLFVLMLSLLVLEQIGTCSRHSPHFVSLHHCLTLSFIVSRQMRI
jgi:hypothetical protein